MTATAWVLKGTEYGNCNCDYGCPCQFNGCRSLHTTARSAHRRIADHQA
jgi:hypothetical protein